MIHKIYLSKAIKTKIINEWVISNRLSGKAVLRS